MKHIEILQRFMDARKWRITFLHEDSGSVYATLDSTTLPFNWIQIKILPDNTIDVFGYHDLERGTDDNKDDRHLVVVKLLESLGLDNFTVELVL